MGISYTKAQCGLAEKLHHSSALLSSNQLDTFRTSLEIRMSKNCLGVPCHSKGEAFGPPGRGHQKNGTGKITFCSQLLKALEIPGQSHSGRWANLSSGFTAAGFGCQDLSFTVYLFHQVPAHTAGFCIFSCECFSAVGLLFSLLYLCTVQIQDSALFFSRWSIHIHSCKENLSAMYNKWDREWKKEEGEKRKKPQKRHQLTTSS